MSVRITIPGVDFSSSGLPKFAKTIAGFEALDSLEALWLFEDGANGDVISTALDSSGKGKHGSLFAGSISPVKEAGGVGTSASGALSSGFAFESNIPIDGEKTIFVCYKNDDTTNTLADEYVQAVATKLVSPLSNSQSALNPAILLNSQIRTAALGSAAALNVGAFTGSGAVYIDGTSSRRTMTSSPSLANDVWVTLALSISAANGRIRIATGITSTTSEMTSSSTIAHVASLQMIGQTIKAGIFRNSGVNVDGKIGIFGVYSKESTTTELTGLCAKMQTRMALRGVTAH